MAISKKKYTDPDMNDFDRCLGQYRAKVYELYLGNDLTDTRHMNIDQITQPSSEKPTILVVENNADEWFLIRWTLLQLFPQAQAVWVSNVAQANNYLQASTQSKQSLPRLILQDLYLPDSQAGLALLKTFKNHSRYQQIPLVILSWSNATDDILEAYKYAANAYLTKPVDYKGWAAMFAKFQTYLGELTVAH